MSFSEVTVKTKKNKSQQDIDCEETGPSSRADPVQMRRSSSTAAVILSENLI